MPLDVRSAQERVDGEIAMALAAIRDGCALETALRGVYARGYEHALEHAGYVQQAIREETQDS
jgi:hypothetical protein